MNRLRDCSVIAIEFAILVGALISTLPQSSLAQSVRPPQDVTVVNTTSQAVPVTGTVGLTPGTSVQIDAASNGIRIVRDDENPARQAFQETLTLVVPVGQSSINSEISVPFGKRLVIEFVSIQTRDSEPHRIVFNTKANGNLGSYTFFPAVTGITNFYSLHQQTRIYADRLGLAGVAIVVLRSADVIQGNFNISVSGYLVDIL